MKNLIFVSMMSFLAAALLPFANTVHASSAFEPKDVFTYLGDNNVILCEIQGKDTSVQIQFDGARDEWVVWYLGYVRGAQRILNASVTPLEGFQNEFNLDLERGAHIYVILTSAAIGRGKLSYQGREYNLEDCKPKF